ncbi:MAG: FAD-binding protein, partial [Gammaproteobacteria bacterium]
MTPGAGYRIRAMIRIWLIVGLGFLMTACAPQEPEARFDADAIVVGAGLSGLSAAVDMGRAGVDVLVVDMNSMAGGHAIMAGGVAIVGTPVQEKAGFVDSPDLA